MARKDSRPGNKEAAAQRRQQALALRTQGKTYRAIAKELGIGEAQAYRDVAAVIKSINQHSQETAIEHQRLELERLEMAMDAIAPAVESGYLPAIDRWLRLCESRRKLLGLDAPVKTENQHTGADGEPLYVVALPQPSANVETWVQSLN